MIQRRRPRRPSKATVHTTVHLRPALLAEIDILANGGSRNALLVALVDVMGRQAEYASHLLKNQRGFVDGRLQISRFQRQDGTPGVAYDVWAGEVQSAGDRGPDGEEGRVAVATGAADPADAFDDNGLPF